MRCLQGRLRNALDANRRDPKTRRKLDDASSWQHSPVEPPSGRRCSCRFWPAHCRTLPRRRRSNLDQVPKEIRGAGSTGGLALSAAPAKSPLAARPGPCPKGNAIHSSYKAFFPPSAPLKCNTGHQNVHSLGTFPGWTWQYPTSTASSLAIVSHAAAPGCCILRAIHCAPLSKHMWWLHPHEGVGIGIILPRKLQSLDGAAPKPFGEEPEGPVQIASGLWTDAHRAVLHFCNPKIYAFCN